MARAIVVCNNFQEGFAHYIKIRHFKGESKSRESSRRLYSNGLDTGGLKATI